MLYNEYKKNNDTKGETEMISIEVIGEDALVNFDFNMDIVNILRGQPNRKWDAKNKCWVIPVRRLGKLLNSLDKYEITILGEQERVVVQTIAPDNFKFKTTPFQHQIEGFEYGLKKDRFLLGDEQGLGKTKQSIDIAVARKLMFGYKHCLIICGVNGLKWNWESEVAIHSNEQSKILGSRINRKGRKVIKTTEDKIFDIEHLPEAYFLITNVESLRSEQMVAAIQKQIRMGNINMVIMDEIHKCKNPTSQQGKALLKVQGETKIALSGTPLMNNPMDLFIVLKWLGYESNAFYSFKNHYCVMGGFGGYEIVGYRNLDQLQSNLNDIMLRRLKKDVLDLPEKLHSTEYVEMSKAQAKIYNEVSEEVRANIDKIAVSPNPLAQLIRLRQATASTDILSTVVHESAKLDRLEELVEELAENNEKCIIFSNWTEMTNRAYERLAKYNPAIITGETKDRVAEQDRFTHSPMCKCIIGTIGAMGTGLTLTAGTTVIFLDSPWNRANKEQAEDRAHRIGTTSTVNIVTLVCKDTIDERIEELVYQKGAMADMLVDGKTIQNKAQMIDYLLS